MSLLLLAVVTAVASAGCYALGAVLQERLAVVVPLRTLGTLLRHRRWWLAVGLGCAGALLHVVALRFGPLSLVQPLGALALVLALPVGSAVGGQRVTRAQWRGAALTVAGLAGLLLLTASAGRPESLQTGEVLVVVALATVAVVALGWAALTLPARAVRLATQWFALRPPVPVGAPPSGPAPQPPVSHSARVVRSLLFAAAAGLSFGVGSALVQTVAVRATSDGVTGLVSPATPTAAGFAIGGFLLAQAAYRGSGLGAPLAMLTLMNPATAAVIGLVLLGERFAGGALGATAAVIAATLAVWGVVLLARPAPEGLGRAARGKRAPRTPAACARSAPDRRSRAS